MVKSKNGMALLQGDWKRLSTQRRLDLIPDNSYRDSVVDECFEELGKPQTQYRNLSAVDRVIEECSRTKTFASMLLTFNPKDFSDVVLVQNDW